VILELISAAQASGARLAPACRMREPDCYALHGRPPRNPPSRDSPVRTTAAFCPVTAALAKPATASIAALVGRRPTTCVCAVSAAIGPGRTTVVWSTACMTRRTRTSSRRVAAGGVFGNAHVFTARRISFGAIDCRSQCPCVIDERATGAIIPPRLVKRGVRRKSWNVHGINSFLVCVQRPPSPSIPNSLHPARMESSHQVNDTTPLGMAF
jgi:hypothetical protein